MIPLAKSLLQSSFWKYCISLLIALSVGINIYHRVSPPPYGYPLNELSDNYWGVIVDIAHRWRDFDFSLWSRGLGGGVCLFNSGEYPILNPTNALAWFFNDNAFYLIKLIEPYVLGVFFMMVLLWEVFQTRWYIACFGGLAYMGLTIAKASTIAESPYFLYGCGLFPGMVFVFLKLLPRHVYLAALGLGAFLALQFLGEGATQMPQLIIWWILLLTIYIASEWLAMRGKTEGPNRMPAAASALKKWFLSVFILVSGTIGLSAIQMIPSIHFFHYESARLSGFYPINNFALWGSTTPAGLTMSQYLFGAFFNAGPVRTKMFMLLIFIGLAVASLDFGRIFSKNRFKNIIYQIWAATIIYFLIPPTAQLLSSIFPFLKGAFSFLTYFSFRYGLHILDFCIVLSFCLILNNDGLSIRIKSQSFVKNTLGISFLILTLMVALLPIVFSFWPHAASWPFLTSFIPSSFQQGLKFSLKAAVVIFLIAFRPWNQLRHWTMAFLLIGVGFMMLLDCFKWYDKGCRTHPEDYQLSSPEHNYYRQAQGKYFFPYITSEPVWTAHNYNLLYGVDGVSGFMALTPSRAAKFRFYYNNRFQENFPILSKGENKFFLIEGPIRGSFATYFPIDFTMIAKDSPLSWEGFAKVVSGEKFDVYERAKPAPRVYFARDLKIVPLLELLHSFDEPRSDIVYITQEDAKIFALSAEKLSGSSGQARYQNFYQNKADRLSFEVLSDQETFVTVPERFEKGWQVRLDGYKIPIFPAYYLFIGFRMPAGSHRVELSYYPPWFWTGLIINVLSIAGAIFLLKYISNLKGETYGTTYKSGSHRCL